MNLKLFAAAAAGALALAAANAASAAVVLDFTPFDHDVGTGNLENALHNTGDATAPTVTLDVQGKPYLVSLTGNTNLDQGGNGGGFAIVNGNPYFDTLSITPDNFAGFTAFQFTIAGQNKTANNKNISYGTFDLAYTLAGGGGSTLQVNFPNNGKVRIYGDAGEVLTSLTLSNLKGTSQGNVVAADFADIRQMSFNAALSPAAVPEPASWAMMLVGFGAMGAMVRRRRMAPAAVAA